MARGVNQVTLLGNITRDPDFRQTPNGMSVVTLSLAVNHSFKDKSGEWQNGVNYFTIICWRALADRCDQFLRKGSKVLVLGKLQSRQWEKDGKKFSRIEVVANDVMFLDGRKSQDESIQADEEMSIQDQQREVGTLDDEPINLDEIPF